MLPLFSGLAGLVSAVGPIVAVAGGPAGVALAWLGSQAANKTVKYVAISVGLLLLVGVSVGITIHIQRLEQDRAAYTVLKADVASLEARYGCPARPVHERALAACLTARERDAEDAKGREILRLQGVAALAQAALDRANAALEQQSQQIEDFISGAKGDGPVPQIMIDYYARQRAARGVK